MKFILNLILFVLVAYGFVSCMNRSGILNEDAEEVADSTKQELTKKLGNLSSEQEIIKLFRRMAIEEVSNVEYVFNNTKSVLHRSGTLTNADFDNELNRIQVIRKKCTVILEKLREVELTDEEARQEVVKILENELEFADNLEAAIKLRISDADFREPLSKTRMLWGSLSVAELPNKFSKLYDENNTLYDRVKFFRYVRNDIVGDLGEIFRTTDEQLNGKENFSEIVSACDLQSLQLQKTRVQMILDKAVETDFQYEHVKEKFIEALELELAISDGLTATLEARINGEDWQPAWAQVNDLIQFSKATGKIMREIEDAVEDGKEPPNQRVEELVQQKREHEQERIKREEEKAQQNAPQSPPVIAESLNDEDKAAVKAYLESTQPLVLFSFGQEIFNISTPLASNDPEKLKMYAEALSRAGGRYSNPNNAGAAKAQELCEKYFMTEALIADYYIKLKEENKSDGLIDDLANTLGKAKMIGGVGDLNKLYSLQSDTEAEIKRLATWSGAELYGSWTEAKIKITGNAWKDMIFK